MKGSNQSNILKILNKGKPIPKFLLEQKLNIRVSSYLTKLRKSGYIEKYGSVLNTKGRTVPTYKITAIGKSALERFEYGYYG